MREYKVRTHCESDHQRGGQTAAFCKWRDTSTSTSTSTRTHTSTSPIPPQIRPHFAPFPLCFPSFPPNSPIPPHSPRFAPLPPLFPPLFPHFYPHFPPPPPPCFALFPCCSPPHFPPFAPISPRSPPFPGSGGEWVSAVAVHAEPPTHCFPVPGPDPHGGIDRDAAAGPLRALPARSCAAPLPAPLPQGGLRVRMSGRRR